MQLPYILIVTAKESVFIRVITFIHKYRYLAVSLFFSLSLHIHFAVIVVGFAALLLPFVVVTLCCLCRFVFDTTCGQQNEYAVLHEKFLLSLRKHNNQELSRAIESDCNGKEVEMHE